MVFTDSRVNVTKLHKHVLHQHPLSYIIQFTTLVSRYQAKILLTHRATSIGTSDLYMIIGSYANQSADIVDPVEPIERSSSLSGNFNHFGTMCADLCTCADVYYDIRQYN